MRSDCNPCHPIQGHCARSCVAPRLCTPRAQAVSGVGRFSRGYCWRRECCERGGGGTGQAALLAMHWLVLASAWLARLHTLAFSAGLSRSESCEHKHADESGVCISARVAVPAQAQTWRARSRIQCLHRRLPCRRPRPSRRLLLRLRSIAPTAF